VLNIPTLGVMIAISGMFAYIIVGSPQSMKSVESTQFLPIKMHFLSSQLVLVATLASGQFTGITSTAVLGGLDSNSSILGNYYN
jgi:hypothetical protein